MRAVSGQEFSDASPTRKERPTTFVYVIEAGEVCKVGIAADPLARLAFLLPGIPFRASVAQTVAVARGMALVVERAAHAKLATRRTRGEWFAVGAREAKKAARDACRALDLPERPDDAIMARQILASLRTAVAGVGRQTSRPS